MGAAYTVLSFRLFLWLYIVPPEVRNIFNDPEAALLRLNTRAGHRASIPSDLMDYDPYAFLWDTPPLF